MGRGSVSSKFVVILNIIYPILGLGLIGLSIYFFLRLTDLISLRNENHFKLDTNVYWIQALPWIFVVSGAFAILVSCCAFLGVLKKSRPLVLTNVMFQVLTICLLAASATLSLKYANSTETDKYLNLTINDAFEYMKSANKPEVDKAFQAMEVTLQCCGLSGPSTSYIEMEGKWTTDYPLSCCKSYINEPIESCPKRHPIANTRKGCVDVAIHNVRFAVKIFAAAAIVTGIIGLLNLVSSIMLSNGLSNRKKVMKAKLVPSEDVETHRNIVKMSDMDTLKMPLKV